MWNYKTQVDLAGYAAADKVSWQLIVEDSFYKDYDLSNKISRGIENLYWKRV